MKESKLYINIIIVLNCSLQYVYNQGEDFVEEVGGEPGLWGGGNSGGKGNGKIDFGGGGGGGDGVIPGTTIGGKREKGGGLDGGGWNGFGRSGGGLEGGGWNGLGRNGGGLGGWNGFGIKGGLGGWKGLGINGGGVKGLGIKGGWNGLGTKGGFKGFGGKKKKSSTSFFLGFWVLCLFWSQNFGFFIGLNEKNPAEKMCSSCNFFFRVSENEVEVEAIAQFGSLLLNNLKLHPLILFTFFLTKKGSFTLNSPCSLVFTSL